MMPALEARGGITQRPGELLTQLQSGSKQSDFRVCLAEAERVYVIRDLDNLIEMEVAIGGKGYAIRGQTAGVARKVFQACGVALPPVLRQC